MIPEVYLERIVYARGREIARIWNVVGRGSFLTLTKTVPAGHVVNFGLNSHYIPRGQ